MRFIVTLPAVRRHAVLLSALVLLSLLVGCVVAQALWLSGGVFTYGRDDAYIHMAIAKNLVLHHVWGVTPYAFASASSSPLWTLLVAGSYQVFGIGDKAPLVLGFLSAVALMLLLYNLLKREGLDRFPLAVTLYAVIFVMPMPYLVLDGMEPALHTTLTIGFLYLAGVILCGEENRREEVVLALLAPLLVAARFEGLFLLTLTAGLLALQRRYLYASVLIALGALPVLMLGIPSMLHGGWILPNSVMLKGHRPSGSLLASVAHLTWTAVSNLGESGALLLIAVLAMVALVLSADRKNFWRPPIVWLALFLGMLASHLAFAQIGNPFRYEAYLIVSGLFVLAACSKEPWAEQLIFRLRSLRMRSPTFAAILLLILSFPLTHRGLDGFFRAAGAAHNCFEQQYQTARFVQRFYAGQSLVLNDIGYISYLSDIRLIDLAGLGSNEILRERAVASSGKPRNHRARGPRQSRDDLSDLADRSAEGLDQSGGLAAQG